MIGLSWTRGAARDLQRHVEYIAQFDAAAAERVGDAVQTCAEWLRHTPFAGQALAGTRLRFFGVRRTPLIILYRVDGAVLSIARVVHTRQNWR